MIADDNGTAPTSLPAAGLGTLLALRWAMLCNRLRSTTLFDRLKLAALGLVTLGFMLGEGALTYILLRSIHTQEDLGALFVAALLQRLLTLVFLVVLGMLFFSNITASIATIYLSRDLDLLLATPVTVTRVFMLKLLETILNSSYMAVLFVLPILVAYGLVFATSPLFYLQLPIAFGLFVIPPAAAGITVTMLLMRYLPARRTQQAMSVVGLMMAISLITMLRLNSPERLLAPTSSEDFKAILRALTIEGAQYLPSSWIADTQVAALQGDWSAALGAGLPLLVLALLSLAATLIAARSIYFLGVSAAREGARRARDLTGVAPSHLGLTGRDVRLFFRDPAQWSQLLLLGALIIIYVFNITALPRGMLLVGTFITLRDLLAMLNVGLAGFVLAAIAMRFVLPALSIEGGAFWLYASSPASRRAYLKHKLTLYLPPMLLFGLVLVALSDHALGVDAFTRNLSLGTSALVIATLTAMAVGIGAAMPSFKLENPAQFVLTSGGVLYGVLSMLYIVAVVAIEARPFFWHLLIQAGTIDAAAVSPARYHVAMVALSALLTVVTLRIGDRRLARLEM